MLPRLTPLKMRPIISPVVRRLSIARSDSSASARIVAVGLDEFGAPSFEKRQEQRLGIRIAGFRERANRAEPGRLVAARELHRRLGQRQQRLDLRVLLFRKRALDHGQHVLVGAALQRLRGREPRRAVASQRAAAPRLPVASSRRTRLLRTTSSRDSGSGSTLAPVAEIDGGAVLDAEHRLARRLHFTRSAATAAAADAPASPEATSGGDGLDLLVVLAEREIVHELRRRSRAWTSRGTRGANNAHTARIGGDAAKRQRGMSSWS